MPTVHPEPNHQAVSAAVAALYNTYPFPPEPLIDEAPLGYNWRWSWQTAYSFCTGRKPDRQNIRILDAGCGTGCGTEYLVHLNPEAEVMGIDLSLGALEVARERCARSVQGRAQFQELSLFDVGQLPGQFEFINCVGVLHHTADPVRGIQALAAKLAPGGLMHIFVYGELGRWEVRLMQEAIRLLQGERRGDYEDGVNVGRSVFASLPETNPLVRREKERWSMENHRDACFADMYVHPQEIDYNVNSLFDLIETSGLEFVGFSNPQVWQTERLLGQAPDLMERVQEMTDRDRYRLTELLDPGTFTHYEFFLAKPPLPRVDWSTDAALMAAIPELSPCISGWPGTSLFNFEYQVVQLAPEELAFLEACEGNIDQSVGTLMAQAGVGADRVRHLQTLQLILLH
jgi:SAM-dependent methyltransferase